MSTQVMEVTSTHCSATFGSKESVSVGVSGREEPDSWIWHNSSSVMMSNTASSGGLKSKFVPGWQRRAGQKRHTKHYTQDGEGLWESEVCSYTEQAAGTCLKWSLK